MHDKNDLGLSITEYKGKIDSVVGGKPVGQCSYNVFVAKFE
jgi:hypothetical protein